MKTEKFKNPFGPNAFKGEIVKNNRSQDSIYEGGDKANNSVEDFATNPVLLNLPTNKVA